MVVFKMYLAYFRRSVNVKVLNLLIQFIHMTFAHEFSRYHIKSKTSPKNFYRLQVFVSIYHLLLNLSEQTQQTTGNIITNIHKSRITKYCHFVIFPSCFLNKIATNLKITFYFLKLFFFSQTSTS